MKRHLAALKAHLVQLRDASKALQALLGDDSYSALPTSALRILEDRHKARYQTASFSPGDNPPAPDPLWWRGFEQADSTRACAFWVDRILPTLEAAIVVLQQPGAWAGSAERIFAERGLDLWIALHAFGDEPPPRPSRRTLADWLTALFDWAAITTEIDLLVLAKRLLARRASGPD